MTEASVGKIAKGIAAAWIGLPSIVLLLMLVDDLKSPNSLGDRTALGTYSELVRVGTGDAGYFAKVCDGTSCSDFQNSVVETSYGISVQE